MSIEQAHAELAIIGARISQEHPDTNGGWGVAVRPLDEAMTADVQPILVAVAVASALLLGMTAVNALNLNLARGWLHQSEIAVHAALGASPAQLFRMFLAERAVIAAFGALGGVLIGSWLVVWLRASAAAIVPRISDVAVGGTEIGLVLASALFLALFEAAVLQRR